MQSSSTSLIKLYHHVHFYVLPDSLSHPYKCDPVFISNKFLVGTPSRDNYLRLTDLENEMGKRLNHFSISLCWLETKTTGIQGLQMPTPAMKVSLRKKKCLWSEADALVIWHILAKSPRILCKWEHSSLLALPLYFASTSFLFTTGFTFFLMFFSYNHQIIDEPHLCCLKPLSPSSGCLSHLWIWFPHDAPDYLCS